MHNILLAKTVTMGGSFVDDSDNGPALGVKKMNWTMARIAKWKIEQLFAN